MEGHVRRIGQRWYPVIERAPDPETGRRRRATLGGYATRTEARQALRTALEHGRKGWDGPERVGLASYLRDEWLPGVDLELSPTTAALYRTLLEHHVIPRLGGEKLQRITPAMLTKLYGDLLASGGPSGRALSPKSVRNVHTTLRKALGDAVASKRVDWNAAEAAKVPKVDRDLERTVWSAADVARFVESTESDRLGALYLLAATSGMRRGELLGLRWPDVDLDAEPPTLRVRRSLVQYGSLVTTKEPKTAASRRTITLHAEAASALRSHKARQAQERLVAGSAYSDSGLVFPDEIGRPLRPDAASGAFAQAVKAAGVPRLTLHGLRHTFATLGLESGVDTLYLSEILGHSSPAITAAIYQHSTQERLTAAVNTVGAAIFGTQR